MASLDHLTSIVRSHLPNEQLLIAQEVERPSTDPRDQAFVDHAMTAGWVGFIVVGGARLVRRTLRGSRTTPTEPVVAAPRLARESSDVVPFGWSTLAVGTEHLVVFGRADDPPYLGAIPRTLITKVFVDQVARRDPTRQLSLVFADHSYVSVRHRAKNRLDEVAALLQAP